MNFNDNTYAYKHLENCSEDMINLMENDPNYFSTSDQSKKANATSENKAGDDFDFFDMHPVVKKRRDKKKKKRPYDPNRPPSNKKIVNLPASPANVRVFDGEERLCFKYNTKVSETALNSMPRGDLEDNEFCVRFDVENVDISKLSEKFKRDNCIYPRVCCPLEHYRGNRWAYETEVNKLAWQFVALNTALLYGKKGLLQRAVDSFRNINNQSRSRRVSKQEKGNGPIGKRRQSESTPYTATIQWIHKGNPKRFKIRVDVENADIDTIDEDFVAKFSVFPDTFNENSFGESKWKSSNKDNEIAVKIAHLNSENTSFWNAIKATSKREIMKKAVEAFKNKNLTVETESEEHESISGIVQKTIENA